eukprot:COSAG01_NODE_1136_length_11548_cov_30.375404_6_plen_47_part_00
MRKSRRSEDRGARDRTNLRIGTNPETQGIVDLTARISHRSRFWGAI